MESAFRERVRCARLLTEFESRRLNCRNPADRICREEQVTRRQTLLDQRFDCGLKVLRLAIDGEEIPDARYDGVLSSPIERVETELCLLFKACVYTPVEPLRGKLFRIEASNTESTQAKINALVLSRIDGFLEVANMAKAKLKDIRPDDDASQQHGILKAALKRALLCVCDSYRYMSDLKRARAAIGLAQCISREDPEVHHKLAILHQIDTSSIGCSNLAAMLHYCRALASERPEEINEKTQGYCFVAHVKAESERAQSRSSRSKSAVWRFSNAYVSLAWRLLAACDASGRDKHVNSSKVTWTDLEAALQVKCGQDERLTEFDLLYIIGTAMFVRHRASPRGHPSKALQLIAPDADDMLCQLMSTLCKAAKREVDELASAMRARKKNRVRSRQKRRQASASLPSTGQGKQTVGSEASSVAGLDILKYVFSCRKHMRTIGPLSFLAHFWSKTLVITPHCELRKFKEVYDALLGIFDTLSRIFEIAGVPDAGEQVMSSVITASKTIPSHAEDYWFADYEPCRTINMFRRVRLQRAAFVDHFRGTEDTVQSAIDSVKIESLSEIACDSKQIWDDLEAFAARLTTSPLACGHEGEMSNGRKRALGILASFALRQQRLVRLRDKFDKHASGRIARLPNQSEQPPTTPNICSELRQVLSSPGFPMKRNSDHLDQQPAEDPGVSSPADPSRPLAISDLPRHKRRRIISAKSQHPWDDSNAHGSLNLRVRQAADVEPRRTGQAEVLGHVDTPIRSVAEDTLVPLGQRLSPLSAKTDTPLVPRVPKARRAFSIGEAVNAIFFEDKAGCGGLEETGGNLLMHRHWAWHSRRADYNRLKENPFLALDGMTFCKRPTGDSRSAHRTV